MKNLHLTKNQTSKMGIQPVMITDVALSEFLWEQADINGLSCSPLNGHIYIHTLYT